MYEERATGAAGVPTAATSSELAEKDRRVREFLWTQGLDGVLLGTVANFAWVTGGRTNRVGAATEVGSGALLITHDERFLICDEIEAPRLIEEELVGQAVTAVTYPWHAPDPLGAVRRVTGGRIASDLPVDGLEPLPGAFAGLRWVLSSEEIERYRWVGEHAGVAITHALFHLRPGLSEQQIAAMLAEILFGFGLQPTVLLVAADERIARYRHPLPTERRLKGTALLVVGARRWGLVASLTRMVHFGEADEELQRRHRAVVTIDAAMIQATRPGTVVGEIVQRGLEVYGAQGFADEWKWLHQGGLTGYVGREYRATVDTPHVVCEGQAFAWNPSIAGTKSEDTILATAGGPEMLTLTPDLPQMEIDGMQRPGILIR